MSMTVRQVAEKLEITKQAVNSRMNEIHNFRDNHVRKVGNRFEIDDEGVKVLASFNSDRQEQQQTTNKNDKNSFGDNDILVKQLSIKDKQIADLHKMLDQQQQLQLQQQQIQLTTVQENRQLKAQIKTLGGYVEDDSGKNTGNKQNGSENHSEPSSESKSNLTTPDQHIGFFRKLFGRK